MTRFDELDQALVAWFDGETIAPAPTGLLDRVTAATAQRRPRPRWQATLRQAGVWEGIRAPMITATAPRIGRQARIAVVLALLAVAALMAALIAGSQRPDPPVQGIFTSLAGMPGPATRGLALPDGSVLAFGGSSQARSGLLSASTDRERLLVFRPADGTFRAIGWTDGSVTSAAMITDGRVLIIVMDPPSQSTGGGSSGRSRGMLVDPTTGGVADVGPTALPRLFAGMVRLADGRVLLIGAGAGGRSAEIFDPASGSFALTGFPDGVMTSPTATLLDDGRVLVISQSERTAELFDPETERFVQTGSLLGIRSGFTATRLLDGRVLIAGGSIRSEGEEPRLATTAEIYDPKTGTFSATAAMIHPRTLHYAVALPSGLVLIGGGTGSEFAGVGDGGIVEPGVVQAELFDPRSGTFNAVASPTRARFGAGAVLLADGAVLIFGSADPLSGRDGGPEATSVETYR